MPLFPDIRARYRSPPPDRRHQPVLDEQTRSRRVSRILGPAMVALLPLAVAACTTFGGRSQRVTLVTDPPGATAFVITYMEWLDKSGDVVLFNDEVLERYRVKAGCTPVVADLPPYEYVFVADWNGHREFTRFVPKAGRPVKLSNPLKQPSP